MVFQMVPAGNERAAIAEHLGSIATGRMGTSSEPTVDLDVGALLLTRRDVIATRDKGKSG
jgi:hypothetical protein